MFSYAESVATRNTVMSSIRQTIEASYSKPTVSIKIHDEPETGTKYYTTGDKIEGEVSIVAPADTRFDDICIAFEGTSRTWLEKFGASPATPGRTTMTNTFLRLVQPVDEVTLPIPRVVTAGQAVKVPFTFVIPECVLPDSCTHSVENTAVKAAHLRLPPSLGDLAALGGKDDQAPDMAQISYAIRVRVSRKKDTTNQNIILATQSHRVLVSPAAEDQPPLHMADSGNGGFVLHKEKDLRKGLLGRKLGRLSITAQQPQALHLAPNCLCPATTTVPVSLSFAAADWQTPPPPLGNLTIKLKTTTYFSTTRTPYIPSRARPQKDLQVGAYLESTLLSSRCIANSAWKLTTTAAATPPPPRPVYTATLSVPITEPKCKLLVPSFSTCYVTRAYALELAVGVHTSNHSQPSLTLKIPLQISQPLSQETEVAAGTVLGVEQFFTPRSVAPPPEAPAYSRSSDTGLPLHMLQNAANLPPPPGYSVFGGQVAGVPLRIPEPLGISPGCG